MPPNSGLCGFKLTDIHDSYRLVWIGNITSAKYALS